MAKSAVSKQVSQLEQEVGIRLLNRTTRQLSLTEAGEIYYQHCLKLIWQAEQALDELRQYQKVPTGKLKITSPISFGTNHLVPVVQKIRQDYPELKIELLLEDRIINMVEEGIDLSIRIGWLQESNLVAKKICDSRMHLIASPEYILKHGAPSSPEDISEHSWVALSLLSSPLRWVFKDENGEHAVQVSSDLRSNSVDTVAALVAAGQGITALARYVVEKELSSGELEVILPNYQIDPVGIYAVYPHREHTPPKIRVFIDYLMKHCRENASSAFLGWD